VVAGWAAAAWQISIGFALGIWFAYALAGLAALCAIAWLRRGRPSLPRPLLTSTAIGGGIFLLVTGLMVRPYLRILGSDPNARAGPGGGGVLLAAGAQPAGRARGEPRLGRGHGVRARHPALVTGAGAVPGCAGRGARGRGLRWRGATRGLRIGLFVGGGILVLLSLGFGLLGGALYSPLYELAPGWSGLRTPGRLAFLWSLCLALLAGFGAQRWPTACGAPQAPGPVRRTSRRWRACSSPRSSPSRAHRGCRRPRCPSRPPRWPG
jgi:hypothetical protein